MDSLLLSGTGRFQLADHPHLQFLPALAPHRHHPSVQRNCLSRLPVVASILPLHPFHPDPGLFAGTLRLQALTLPFGFRPDGRRRDAHLSKPVERLAHLLIRHPAR